MKNGEIDMSVEGERILVSPATKEWKVKDLLAGITRRNSHREISWGGRSGGEAW
jgi:antitoxin component of MazEF toxin-antitoxin module